MAGKIHFRLQGVQLAVYKIKKGLDIPLTGKAEERLNSAPTPQKIGVMTRDFRMVKFQLLVEEGQEVKVGTPLLQSKADPDIVLVSTAAGKVSEIRRGDRRALLAVVVDVENTTDALDSGALTLSEISALESSELAAKLKQGGIWPLIKQRPFNRIPDSSKLPKSIFINGMETAPLAANPSFLLKGRKDFLQAGITALNNFAPGKVHFITKSGENSADLTDLNNCSSHSFSGPHPSGLPGVHIHHIDPINKGDSVWTINAFDASLLGEFLLSGKTPTETIVTVCGENASDQSYQKIIRGAEFSSFVQTKEDSRIISGDVLNGITSQTTDFCGFTTHTVSVLPDKEEQYYLGSDKHWGSPGFTRYTASRLFASSFIGKKNWSLNTMNNGDERAIILQDVYERYLPMDIYATFLVKSCIAGDIENMEKLGLYEVEPEDLALCTFACPSKVDAGAELLKAQELIEKES